MKSKASWILANVILATLLPLCSAGCGEKPNASTVPRVVGEGNVPDEPDDSRSSDPLQVRGLVFWPRGGPAAGVRVDLRMGETHLTTETDDKGAFCLGVRRKQKCVLIVEPQGVVSTLDVSAAEGYSPRNATPVVLNNVTPGESPIRIHLGLGLEIRGQVLDGSGKPVPSAMVLAASSPGEEDHEAVAHASTDSQGHFLLRGLVDRAYWIEAIGVATGSRGLVRDVAPGASGVKVILAE